MDEIQDDVAKLDSGIQIYSVVLEDGPDPDGEFVIGVNACLDLPVSDGRGKFLKLCEGGLDFCVGRLHCRYLWLLFELEIGEAALKEQ